MFFCCSMLQEVDLMELPTNARSELWRWGEECNRSIQNLAVRSWKFTPQRALKMDHHVELHDLGFCIHPSPGCEIVWKLMAKWAARKLCCDRQVARTVWGRGTFQPDEGSFKRNPWRKMEDMSFWNGSSPKWWYVNWSKSTCILFISKYCIDTYARYRYVVFSRCVPYSKLALTPALYVGAEQQL